jgi:chromosome segregation ATPase
MYTRITAQQSWIVGLQSDLSAAQTLLQQQGSQLLRLAAADSAFKDTDIALADGLGSAQAAAAALTVRVADAETTTAVLSASVVANVTALQSADEAIVEAAATLRDRMTQAESVVTGLESRVDHVEATATAIHATVMDHSSSLSAHSTLIKALQSTDAAFLVDLAALQSANASLHSAAAQLADRVCCRDRH